MLFNSHVFIFAFLPAVVAGFYVLGGIGRPRAARAYLVAASLFFYGWWNPSYVLLLLISVIFNYFFAILLARNTALSGGRLLLALGVAVDLGVLGYFKYTHFVLGNVAALTGFEWSVGAIILPLGISFFTFQQIAFLVDVHRGKAHEYYLLDYALFVTFFPQLISGPIVHHMEMMPQFAGHRIGRFRSENLAVGSAIFFIGLFKKVVLADNAAIYATRVFAAADAGIDVGFLAAWQGTIAFAVQLYFDFSGYSDMAIGLGRLFGIRLPLNFNSPYKAIDIVDFWRRWHMTLSRFLRDYLYIPLGGNRRGLARRYANVMIVMLLGGLWHGSGWNFVVWGGLHGCFLALNRLWREWLAAILGMGGRVTAARGYRLASQALTLLAVVFAWAFFRAETFDGALIVAAGMIGMNGFMDSYQSIGGLSMVCAFMLLAAVAPNTQQIMRGYRPAIEPPEEVTHPLFAHLIWRPTAGSACAVAVVALTAILTLGKTTEFLYFNF